MKVATCLCPCCAYNKSRSEIRVIISSRPPTSFGLHFQLTMRLPSISGVANKYFVLEGCGTGDEDGIVNLGFY